MQLMAPSSVDPDPASTSRIYSFQQPPYSAPWKKISKTDAVIRHMLQKTFACIVSAPILMEKPLDTGSKISHPDQGGKESQWEHNQPRQPAASTFNQTQPT
ncbi:hypothetical protein Nepgr_002677 [Nepenthes gracilis]|uniref:Uncharacterized protein n=1 Tax=Nepenthes gracilis TaxID=150966 RepID=A0AAD3P7F0_NEPGR|nr:hypothetical protein Nepgr_002677 [Nepenthes gracilis]